MSQPFRNRYFVDVGRFVLQTATVEVEAESIPEAIGAAHRRMASGAVTWDLDTEVVRDAYTENERLVETEFEPSEEAIAAFEAFDQARGNLEGWCLSEGDSVRLCRIDSQDHEEGEQLDSDDEAWRWVGERARAGDQYHLDALAVLEGVNPIERQRIRAFTGA